MELQTMPLRFRVWDKEKEEMYAKLNFWSVAHLINQQSWGEEKINTEEGRFVISQDTGLKDKNGKSIYTGDIVKFGKLRLSVNYRYGFVRYRKKDKHEYLCFESRETEVIGNIWQNPELLEEQ